MEVINVKSSISLFDDSLTEEDAKYLLKRSIARSIDENFINYSWGKDSLGRRCLTGEIRVVGNGIKGTAKGD